VHGVREADTVGRAAEPDLVRAQVALWRDHTAWTARHGRIVSTIRNQPKCSTYVVVGTARVRSAMTNVAISSGSTVA
jgi:hypothetical protein